MSLKKHPQLSKKYTSLIQLHYNKNARIVGAMKGEIHPDVSSNTGGEKG